MYYGVAYDILYIERQTLLRQEITASKMVDMGTFKRALPTRLRVISDSVTETRLCGYLGNDL